MTKPKYDENTLKQLQDIKTRNTLESIEKRLTQAINATNALTTRVYTLEKQLDEQIELNEGYLKRILELENKKSEKKSFWDRLKR